MHNKILNILFFSLLLMSLAFKTFEPESKENTEKRIKATLPSFEIGGITEIPEHFTDYINDNFGGRDFFIAFNSKIKNDIFSVNNHDVAYGLDGWLFYTGVMTSFYNNTIPLTEEELKHIAIIQLERKAWLKLQGMDYYLLMPPLSHTIYPEYLPATFKKHSPLTKREQIIQYLQENTDINIILIDQLLKDNKKNHRLYYKGDSHWNYYGGFYVYQLLVDYFRNIYPNIPPKFNEDGFNVSVEKDKFNGDLYDLMKVDKPLNELDTIFSLKNKCYIEISDSIKGKPWYYLQRNQNTCDTTLPNLFFYRDSYATVIWKPLSYHFNKTVLLWDHNFNPAITKKENCNIVLFEIAEHLTGRLNTENPTEVKEALKKKGIKIELKKKDSSVL